MKRTMVFLGVVALLGAGMTGCSHGNGNRYSDIRQSDAPSATVDSPAGSSPSANDNSQTGDNSAARTGDAAVDKPTGSTASDPTIPVERMIVALQDRNLQEACQQIAFNGVPMTDTGSVDMCVGMIGSRNSLQVSGGSFVYRVLEQKKNTATVGIGVDSNRAMAKVATLYISGKWYVEAASLMGTGKN